MHKGVYIYSNHIIVIIHLLFVEWRPPLLNMVKVALSPLSEHDFIQILIKQNVYKNLRGNGLGNINIFHTKRKKLRGHGILSTITNLWKMLLPTVKKYLLPAAGRFASGVLKDVSVGKQFKESVKSRAKNIKRVGLQILSGKGMQKKSWDKICHTNYYQVF